jgi:peptidoglycan/LPS O-acetylase OafA/YrhL
LRRISNHALTHMLQNRGGEPRSKKTGPFLLGKRLEYKMPGTFRFLLAVAVVLCHLIHMPYYRDLGYYAVRAFFVLSGFAMTAALNEVYGFEGKRFWINRFLRLVPPYLTVCFLTALAIRCYPLEATRFMPRWAYPATAADVAKNLSIMPLAFGGLQFRYIEPAWSLAVEIIMYAILWIGMGRSARGAFICFATGAAYHCYKLFTDAPFAERYFTPEGALLSFAAGALIYFWRERSTLQTRADFALFVSLAWLINFFAEGTLMPDGYAKQAGFYVNIALAALVVVSQPALRPGPLARRIDTVLGNLSYPIFLVHWLGGFAGYLLLSSTVPRGWELVLASAPVIIVLAAPLAWLNGRFVEPLRWRVRSAERPRENAGAASICLE